MSGGLDVLQMKEEDVLKFLAAGTHLGGTNLDFQMDQYVYKRKSDGEGKCCSSKYFLYPELKCLALWSKNTVDFEGNLLYMLHESPGVYIINLKKTWEKLLLAARAIVAIENPADVCVISSRNTGQVTAVV